MQRTSFILVLLCLASATFGQTVPKDFFKAADAFFQKNVTDGKVSYPTIHQDRSELDALNKQLAEMDLKSLDANTKKAVLINAYNLIVITNVVDNYPIKSPMDVPGFFDRVKHDVGGNAWTLDHLENKVLRPEYKDPRFHFVLVCGATGCPPIVPFAYVPSKLDEQLEVQTRKALNDNFFIKTDSRQQKVFLSEIFKWYEGDFKQDQPDVVSYINTYRDVKIPSDYAVGHYNYDWTLNIQAGIMKDDPASNPMTNPGEGDGDDFNLQTYTAGSLLRRGQFDFTLFNSMYTQTKSNWMGQDFSGSRSSLGGTLLQVTYGVSNNARFNVGFDVNFKFNGNSVDSTFNSITAPFEFTNTDSTRVGISSFGPRIKIAPIKGVNNFSIQSTFLFPTNGSLEGRYTQTGDNLMWMDWDRFIWWNQFFYDKTFANDKMQIFLEGDLLFRFKRRRNQTNQIALPASAFLSYFPTPKTTVYVMTQHTETFVSNQAQPFINDWPIGASSTASGIGFKYQFGSSLNVELLYTNFWRAVNAGFGETYNIGIRYIL